MCPTLDAGPACFCHARRCPQAPQNPVRGVAPNPQNNVAARPHFATPDRTASDASGSGCDNPARAHNAQSVPAPHPLANPNPEQNNSSPAQSLTGHPAKSFSDHIGVPDPWPAIPSRHDTPPTTTHGTPHRVELPQQAPRPRHQTQPSSRSSQVPALSFHQPMCLLKPTPGEPGFILSDWELNRAPQQRSLATMKPPRTTPPANRPPSSLRRAAAWFNKAICRTTPRRHF